jgi:hypothetical protein
MHEPPWRRLDLQFPLAEGRGRRETSALRVALGSSRVPCGLCNSYQRAEEKRGYMLDGRPCLNFDCIKGWRKRRSGDPWWDTYLEQRVEKPAKAPQRDYDLDAHEHGFLQGGGWHSENAGTASAPDGRPIAGLTDFALIEEYARSRLDGTFEDALIALQRHGPVPSHLQEVRTKAEQVIAELVNGRDANTDAVKEVFDCSRRLVQEIAKQARQ